MKMNGKEYVETLKHLFESGQASEYDLHCAVCGKPVEVADICDCGWQQDTVMEHYPDEHCGANHMSLNEAREAYKKGEKIY